MAKGDSRRGTRDGHSRRVTGRQGDRRRGRWPATDAGGNRQVGSAAASRSTRIRRIGSLPRPAARALQQVPRPYQHMLERTAPLPRDPRLVDAILAKNNRHRRTDLSVGSARPAGHRGAGPAVQAGDSDHFLPSGALSGALAPFGPAALGVVRGDGRMPSAQCLRHNGIGVGVPAHSAGRTEPRCIIPAENPVNRVLQS